jgi:hypothetical protein
MSEANEQPKKKPTGNDRILIGRIQLLVEYPVLNEKRTGLKTTVPVKIDLTEDEIDSIPEFIRKKGKELAKEHLANPNVTQRQPLAPTSDGS